MLETGVEVLEGSAEVDHLACESFGRHLFDEDPAMKSAICSISGVPIPKRATSIVPRRRPPGRSQSLARSVGIRFLLVMMLARSSRRAASNPPPKRRTSRITWWVRV
jgi:hypothetical protein